MSVGGKRRASNIVNRYRAEGPAEMESKGDQKPCDAYRKTEKRKCVRVRERWKRDNDP